jgi:hypothetical protein
MLVLNGFFKDNAVKCPPELDETELRGTAEAGSL